MRLETKQMRAKQSGGKMRRVRRHRLRIDEDVRMKREYLGRNTRPASEWRGDIALRAMTAVLKVGWRCKMELAHVDNTRI